MAATRRPAALAALASQLLALALLAATPGTSAAAGNAFAGPQQMLPVAKYWQGNLLIPLSAAPLPAVVSAAATVAPAQQPKATARVAAAAGVRPKMQPTSRAGTKYSPQLMERYSQEQLSTAAAQAALQENAARFPQAAASRSATPLPPDMPPGGYEYFESRFPGISNYDQANAGSGIYAGKSYDLDPPDVGFAVGGEYVVQAVQLAVRVWNKQGQALVATTPLTQFFNVTIGDNLDNPRVLYDAGVGRFFIFTWGTPSLDGLSRFPKNPSFQLVAVSMTANPLSGFYYYYYDASLPGLLHGINCPCYPDYQQVGFNSHAVLITGNTFSYFYNTLQGVTIQALSKVDLVYGLRQVAAARWDGDASWQGFMTQGVPSINKTDGSIIGQAFTVQPAFTPSPFFAQQGASSQAFFLSTFSDNTVNSGLELWALSGTETLRQSGTQTLSLAQVTIPTSSYMDPPPATQKPGPTPLGTLEGFPEELLGQLDARMMQVVYANGLLVGAFATAAADPAGGPPKSGIFWVVVRPCVLPGGGLAGALVAEGLITLPGLYLAYPAITVGQGLAVVTYSMNGPPLFPSIGYSYINLTSFNCTQHFTAFSGVEPMDGFGGYYYPGGINFYGSYFAAATDAGGDIWLAGEATPGGPRGQLTNWGTYIVRVSGH